MKTYTELDDLMADPELDLIDICLPPLLHADAAVRPSRPASTCSARSRSR